MLKNDAKTLLKTINEVKGLTAIVIDLHGSKWSKTRRAAGWSGPTDQPAIRRGIAPSNVSINFWDVDRIRGPQDEVAAAHRPHLAAEIFGQLEAVRSEHGDQPMRILREQPPVVILGDRGTDL